MRARQSTRKEGKRKVRERKAHSPTHTHTNTPGGVQRHLTHRSNNVRCVCWDWYILRTHIQSTTPTKQHARQSKSVVFRRDSHTRRGSRQCTACRSPRRSNVPCILLDKPKHLGMAPVFKPNRLSPGLHVLGLFPIQNGGVAWSVFGVADFGADQGYLLFWKAPAQQEPHHLPTLRSEGLPQPDWRVRQLRFPQRSHPPL